MSTVIHRDDKGPLASFSVAASSWENEVCLLESACTSVQFARRNDVILLPFAVWRSRCLIRCLLTRVRICLRLLAWLTHLGEPPTAFIINVLGWGWVWALERKRVALSCCASDGELTCVQFALCVWVGWRLEKIKKSHPHFQDECY